MKTSNILLLTAFALILLGITIFTGSIRRHLVNDCVEAEGAVIEKTYKTDPFTKITVYNNLNVEITQDTLQEVTIEAEENLIGNLSVVVKDDELKISRIYCMKKSNNVLVRISIDTLTQIKSQSGGKIQSVNAIKGDKLEIDMTSASEANLQLEYKNISCNLSAGAHCMLVGSASSLKSTISSGSMLDAAKLIVQEGTISANSGAMADINVTENLTAHASSGSNINYYGNPALKNIDVNSGGNINQK